MDENFPIIDENINPCGGCPDYGSLRGCKSNGGCAKPITHADRVRAMTDEELAMFLDDVQKYNICCKPLMADDCADCMTDLCWQCWRDWLRQEAEG